MFCVLCYIRHALAPYPRLPFVLFTLFSSIYLSIRLLFLAVVGLLQHTWQPTLIEEAKQTLTDLCLHVDPEAHVLICPHLPSCWLSLRIVDG